MIREQNIGEFLEVLSSKAPVPGGGGASALAGALGTALGLMVGNLTVGKKKYAQVEAEVISMMERLTDMQRDMMRLADEDAKVLAASLVPLEVMELAVEGLGILKELGIKGSVMAVSDVGVAVQFARTAVTGAVMNVYINTKSMADRERAGQINDRAARALEKGIMLADEIYDRVLKGLRGN